MDPENNAATSAESGVAAGQSVGQAQKAPMNAKQGAREFAQFKEHSSFNMALALCWLVAVFSILATLFFWWVSRNATDALAEKISQKDGVVAQITSPTYSKVEKEAANFKASVSELKKAHSGKYAYSQFMPDFYKKLTNDVVLDNVSIATDGTVNINGKTKSYRSIADLLMALQSWEKLTGVEMLSSSVSETETGTMEAAFSISAKIVNETSASESSTASVSSEGGV